MPLPVPNLDDRTFEQLVDEARALIPRNLPAWTDHNPSDPGVTLMELFAYFIETTIYEINRVPERSLENFAKLAGAPRKANEPIIATLRRGLDELAKKSRAITAADFELLVANEAKGFLSSSSSLQRDHAADTPAVMIGTTPNIATLLDPVAAGGTTLKLATSITLAVNNLLVLDDGEATEFVRVTAVTTATDVVTVTITPALRFNHAQNLKLSRLLAPIAETSTTLAVAAKTGDTVVVIRPLALPQIGGVLRIDAGVKIEHLRVTGIARAKVFVATVDTPNVFPNEQIVQVIIVPNDPSNPAPIPTPALRQKVFEFLRERGLITTRVQVAAPRYEGVRIDATVARDANSRLAKSAVQQNVESAVKNFLSPLTGGVDGTGWEFGRKVFRSELYQVIEGVAGVDHVQRLLVNEDETSGEFPSPPATLSPTTLMRLNTLTVTVGEQ